LTCIDCKPLETENTRLRGTVTNLVTFLRRMVSAKRADDYKRLKSEAKSYMKHAGLDGSTMHWSKPPKPFLNAMTAELESQSEGLDKNAERQFEEGKDED
jgi:hypothetical protein